MSDTVSVDYGFVLIWLAICSLYTTLLTVTALSVVWILRKRRSSILKSQRPARTPFSELKFNVASPTDTAKSRRVSFSRRTGVAEFVTYEATTRRKNVYEEYRKSLESSSNDFEANASRQPVGHLGKRIFDQQFEKVEAVDFISGLPYESLNNVNFSQQLASLECTGEGKLTAPLNKFELSAFTERSKLLGNNFTAPSIGDDSGQIKVSFSAIQQIEKDDTDEIAKDMESGPSNMGCHGPFSNGQNMSEYIIEVDLNMTNVVKNDEDMSIMDTVHSPVQDVSKSASINLKAILNNDWVADKENIAVNPYDAPCESNFAVNEEPDQVLVFDGKRLTLQPDIAEKDRNYRHDSSVETPQRKTIVLNVNDDLPNFIDDMRNSKCQHSGFNGFHETKTDEDEISDNVPDIRPKRKKINDNTGNISMTQALPTNIIYQTPVISRDVNDSTRRTIAFNESATNNKMTEKVPVKLLSSSGIMPERRRTLVYEDDADNISITQALRSNMLVNEDIETTNKHKTVVFDSDEDNSPVTKAISPNIFEEASRRKTIFFDVDGGNVYFTQALPANIMLPDKQAQEKWRTIIYENDTGDILVTQAIPTNVILPNIELNPESRRTVVYEDDTGNISVTQALSTNILQERVQLDDNKENNKAEEILTTQSLPNNITVKDNDASRRRKTDVYENDTGNISITQAISAQLIPEYSKDKDITFNAFNTSRKPRNRKRTTIVYDNDEDDISMTEAIPANIIQEAKNERKTLIYDEDKADIATTNVFLLDKLDSTEDCLKKPEDLKEDKEKVIYYEVYEEDAHNPTGDGLQHDQKSIMFNADDLNSDISMTMTIPKVLSLQETEKRNTIIFDNDNCDISITKPIPAKLITVGTKLLHNSKNIILDATEPDSGTNLHSDVIVLQASTTNSKPSLYSNTAEHSNLKNAIDIYRNVTSDSKNASSVNVVEGAIPSSVEDVSASASLIYPRLEQKLNQLNLMSPNSETNVDKVSEGEDDALTQTESKDRKTSLPSLLTMSATSADSGTDDKSFMARIESNLSSDNVQQDTDVNTSNESMFYITKDNDYDTQTDRETDKEENNAKPIALPYSHSSMLQLEYNEEKPVRVDDLQMQQEELQSAVKENNQFLSRLFEEVVSTDLEDVVEKDENVTYGKKGHNYKKANNTQELLVIITNFTDNRDSDDDVETAAVKIRNHTEVTEPNRLSFAPNRQPIALSRDDLLNNISMAQAGLQKSRLALDDSDCTEEDTRDAYVDISKKSNRTSTEVVKALRFDDESNTDTSLKFDTKYSSLKKTAFGETSYMNETKAKVIPTYSKDVSVGNKELMLDLVKSMNGTLPFESVYIDKGLTKIPSTQCVQILANLSSQVDLNCELFCNTDTNTDTDKGSSFTAAINKSRSRSLRTLLKFAGISSEMSSEFDIPEPKHRYSYSPSHSHTPADPPPNMLVFDHLNPLNNILLAPLNNFGVHRYNTKKSEDTLYDCSRSTGSHVNKSSRDNDFEVKTVTTAQYRLAIRTREKQKDVYVYKKQDDHFSIQSTSSSKTIFIDQSLDAFSTQLPDDQLNTMITMKGNKDLLKASSSLTLVNDALDVGGRLSPDNENENRRIKISRSNLVDIEEPATEIDVAKTPDSALSERIDSSNTVANRTKGKKRMYSPLTDKCKQYQPAVEVTPKPIPKMQKISNSPNSNKVTIVGKVRSKDGIKELMLDLVKTMNDNLPFESVAIDKGLIKIPSVQTTQIQANLVTSSQVNLDCELYCDADTNTDTDKGCSVTAAINKSRSRSLRSLVKFSGISSEMSSEFDIPEPKQRYSYSLSHSHVEPPPDLLVFDHLNPLNNILIAPLNYPGVHRYIPKKSHDTHCARNWSTGNHINKSSRNNDFEVETVTTAQYRLAMRTREKEEDVYVYKKQGGQFSIQSTSSSRPISIDQSINSFSTQLRDDQVNTTIARKGNKDLLEESSLVTLVDNALDGESRVSPDNENEKRRIKFLKSNLIVEDQATENGVAKSPDSALSERIDSPNTVANRTKGKKRTYSPSTKKCKQYEPAVEVTLKPIPKMQKISNSLNLNKVTIVGKARSKDCIKELMLDLVKPMNDNLPFESEAIDKGLTKIPSMQSTQRQANLSSQVDLDCELFCNIDTNTDTDKGCSLTTAINKSRFRSLRSPVKFSGISSKMSSPPPDVLVFDHLNPLNNILLAPLNYSGVHRYNLKKSHDTLCDRSRSIGSHVNKLSRDNDFEVETVTTAQYRLAIRTREKKEGVYVYKKQDDQFGIQSDGEGRLSPDNENENRRIKFSRSNLVDIEVQAIEIDVAKSPDSALNEQIDRTKANKRMYSTSTNKYKQYRPAVEVTPKTITKMQKISNSPNPNKVTIVGKTRSKDGIKELMLDLVKPKNDNLPFESVAIDKGLTKIPSMQTTQIQTNLSSQVDLDCELFCNIDTNTDTDKGCSLTTAINKSRFRSLRSPVKFSGISSKMSSEFDISEPKQRYSYSPSHSHTPVEPPPDVLVFDHLNPLNNILLAPLIYSGVHRYIPKKSHDTHCARSWSTGSHIKKSSRDNDFEVETVTTAQYRLAIRTREKQEDVYVYKKQDDQFSTQSDGEGRLSPDNENENRRIKFSRSNLVDIEVQAIEIDVAKSPDSALNEQIDRTKDNKRIYSTSTNKYKQYRPAVEVTPKTITKMQKISNSPNPNKITIVGKARSRNGIKELMLDLVKPMNDNLPFESVAIDKGITEIPSTQSTQIQVNLSSQVDLNSELFCNIDNNTDTDKGSSLTAAIIKSRSRSLRSPVKFFGISSDMSSEFDIPEPKQRYSYSSSYSKNPVKPPPDVLVFDHLNPLNNILLAPLIYSGVHRYIPKKSNDTHCDRSWSTGSLINKSPRNNDFEVETVTTPHYRLAIQNRKKQQDVYVYKKQEEQFSIQSTSSSRPISIDQSIDAFSTQLRDDQVNTMIAMKENKDLLEASSSLTLVDDALDGKGRVSPDNGNENRMIKFSRSNLVDVEKQATEIDVAKSPDSALSERIDRTKGKKRIYSPSTDIYKQYQPAVEVTPNFSTKMQKISNSPNPNKVTVVGKVRSKDIQPPSISTDESTHTMAPEKDVSEPIERSSEQKAHTSNVSEKKSPKVKETKQGPTISVQQSLLDYRNLDNDFKYISEKQLLEDLNLNPKSESFTAILQSDVSFTSSKNVNAMKDVNSTSTTECQSPHQSSATMQSMPSQTDWHPSLICAINSNVCGSDSSVNVVAKIDMLPFMGSHECKWESSFADTWSFRLLHGRLRLTARLAHRRDNATRTRVRGDTPVLDIAVEIVQHDCKNPVATMTVHFACETMRYIVSRLLRATCNASDIPPLLRRCAAVARLALCWRRAMHDAKLHLAYTLDNKGNLSLKVVKIPVRSVWEVKMRIELVLDNNRGVPWPRAGGVRVAHVVSNMLVPDANECRALAHTPRDWGHAPRTIWTIFRYLKHKTRDGDLLLAL